MVSLADEIGRPGLGDAIVTAAWLGLKRRDWLTWPAEALDDPTWPLEIVDGLRPAAVFWSTIPPLARRIAVAKERHKTACRPRWRFLFDDASHKPWQPWRFQADCKHLCSLLAVRRPPLRSELVADLDAHESQGTLAAGLTMRTFRHACIANLQQAGFDRDQIQWLTGHTMQTIDNILRFCRNGAPGMRVVASPLQPAPLGPG
jgi:hypothetical protein